MKKIRNSFIALSLLVLSLSGCATTSTGSSTAPTASAVAYNACKRFSKIVPVFTSIKPYMTSNEETISNAAIVTGVNFCSTKPTNYNAVVMGITDSLEKMALSIALQKTQALTASTISGVK